MSLTQIPSSIIHRNFRAIKINQTDDRSTSPSPLALHIAIHLPDENPNSSRCCAWRRRPRLRMSVSLEIHLEPERRKNKHRDKLRDKEGVSDKECEREGEKESEGKVEIKSKLRIKCCQSWLENRQTEKWIANGSHQMCVRERKRVNLVIAVAAGFLMFCEWINPSFRGLDEPERNLLAWMNPSRDEPRQRRLLEAKT